MSPPLQQKKHARLIYSFGAPGDAQFLRGQLNRKLRGSHHKSTRSGEDHDSSWGVPWILWILLDKWPNPGKTTNPPSLILLAKFYNPGKTTPLPSFWKVLLFQVRFKREIHSSRGAGWEFPHEGWLRIGGRSLLRCRKDAGLGMSKCHFFKRDLGLNLQSCSIFSGDI